MLFEPACPTCRECKPLRVLVDAFEPSKSQRRVLRRNADLRVEVAVPTVDDERLELHRLFHAERSRTLGWKYDPAEVEDYERSFLHNTVPTYEITYRIGRELAAVAFVDESAGALSSIYCFHHPAHRRRSLGTFDILAEIQLARRLALDYLYLGYSVRGCRSMEYKANFRPCEVLEDGVWREVLGG